MQYETKTHKIHTDNHKYICALKRATPTLNQITDIRTQQLIHLLHNFTHIISIRFVKIVFLNVRLSRPKIRFFFDNRISDNRSTSLISMQTNEIAITLSAFGSSRMADTLMNE